MAEQVDAADCCRRSLTAVPAEPAELVAFRADKAVGVEVPALSSVSAVMVATAATALPAATAVMVPRAACGATAATVATAA